MSRSEDSEQPLAIFSIASMNLSDQAGCLEKWKRHHHHNGPLNERLQRKLQQDAELREALEVDGRSPRSTFPKWAQDMSMASATAS